MYISCSVDVIRTFHVWSNFCVCYGSFVLEFKEFSLKS